mgnify:CR=1 FL=1
MMALLFIAICLLIAFVLASCVVRDLWPPDEGDADQ